MTKISKQTKLKVLLEYEQENLELRIKNRVFAIQINGDSRDN